METTGTAMSELEMRQREEIDGLMRRLDKAEFDRRIYENKKEQYTRVVTIFDDFLSALVDEDAIDEDSEAYKQHASILVEDGTLEDPFTTESDHRVEVVITYEYDVTVKHPRKMSKQDVYELIVDAFGEVDGERDDVCDDLGDRCEIQGISEWSHNVEVN